MASKTARSVGVAAGRGPWSGRCRTGSRRPAVPCPRVTFSERRRPGPGRGMAGFQAGSQSPATPRAPRDRRAHEPRPQHARAPRRPAARPRRAQASVPAKSSASRRARRASLLATSRPAQLLHELAGVDADRAGGGAQAVGGAGLLAPVDEVGGQPGPPGRVLAGRAPAGPSPAGTVMRWRGVVGQRARRALRLAEAALDAAVDERVDLRQRLQVLEVGLRVVVEDDAGVEDARAGRGAPSPAA